MDLKSPLVLIVHGEGVHPFRGRLLRRPSMLPQIGAGSVARLVILCAGIGIISSFYDFLI
jgi:hypothetical protein